MASAGGDRLFLLFLVSLSLLPLDSFSLSSTYEQEYHKWVSWHGERYRQKLLFDSMEVTSQLKDDLHHHRKMDHKLAMAEENRVWIKVAQDGSGNFTSLRDALDSVEEKNKRRIIIQIAPGIYREKVVIKKKKPFITLLGDSRDPPTFTGNDTAATLGGDGKPMRTYHSPTVAINSHYFVAINIRFENTAPNPEIGQIGGQAVALRISGNKAAFYNCSFFGHQDTLYDHKGVHYFKDCFIQGSVDFIFGYGRSLYENCQMNSISTNVASVTAQKRTNVSLSSGFSFLNGTVSGSGLVYLGRAWGDHSRVVFSYTYLDKVVIPEGWNDWGIPARESSVYYGEYKCSGPGANMTERVHWIRSLSFEEALPFLGTHFIDGQKWLWAAQPAAYLS
ncbi:unnamed protein product [Victoria cruziana]